MCSNGPDPDFFDDITTLDELTKSGYLHDLVRATSLKYDIALSLDNDFSTENLGIFQKSVKNLNKVNNLSRSVKLELLKLYATASSNVSKTLVLSSLQLNPTTDLGEVFIRAFTPKELYNRFDDFPIFNTKHMLLIPEWLHQKLVSDKIDCVNVSRKIPITCVKPESKTLVETTANIWNPLDSSDLYNDFLLSYKTAKKIENLS